MQGSTEQGRTVQIVRSSSIQGNTKKDSTWQFLTEQYSKRHDNTGQYTNGNRVNVRKVQGSTVKGSTVTDLVCSQRRHPEVCIQQYTP